MDSLRDFRVWSRLVVIGLLAAFLGLSALPHRLERAYQAVQQSLLIDSPAGAAKHLAAVLEFEPWRRDVRVDIGRYAALDGDFQMALEYLGDPEVADLLGAQDLILLGDAYDAQGEAEQAVQAWLKALQTADPSEEVYERLLKFHQTRKDYIAIIADLKNLTRLRPDKLEYDFQLGLVMTAFQPQNALVYLEKAAGYNTEAAVKANKLRQSIRTALLVEEPAYTFLESGRSLASLGEWELAEQAFIQATQTRPDYAEAWAFLGEARQHLPDASPQAAVSALQQALSLDPNSIATNSLFALYWQRQGDFEKALIYLQSAAIQEPQNPYLQAEIGRTYSLLGKLPEAQGYYQKAVELAPQDVTFWNLLVQFHLSHQIQVREVALPAARQAVLIAPNDAVALDLMGQTLFLLGDFYSARRFLHRSLSADHSYALAYLHLGLVELYLGDPEQSQQDILYAMQIAQDASVDSYAQRLLQYYFP